ncbi:stage II sporulation protein M [Paenibacillus oenotherae]|uniref:Stage II sporulation protein M n=1 Tax=Paenibacillus oenotherae TaxID=1435645 RepID=A0ABS7D6E5_9BACL|nr:stage II sporulation protein M [Paenibacillus oenotherae]MBW7475503.1 stage II sporulation protein M [Paenibacillus oenotherae]
MTVKLVNTRNLAMIYIALVVVCFTVGYFNAEVERSPEDVEKLGTHFIWFVFIANTVTILFMYVLSSVGLAIPFIIKNLYSIGYAAKASGIPPLIYFPVSLIHGIFELIVLFLVLRSCIQNIKILIFIKKGRESKRMFWVFNKRLLRVEIPLAVVLLMVGALLEILVSNPLVHAIVG